MSTKWRNSATVLLSLAILLGIYEVNSAVAQQAANEKDGTVILKVDGSGAGATTWRYHETWQTEVARTDAGELVRVDPYHPREKQGDAFRLVLAKKIIGSEYPPQDWRNVEFDDSQWDRTRGVPAFVYRSLALLSVRGRFNVTDPAKAGPLSLSLTYDGGVVVYLNGKEVGHANLPAGPIATDTLAEDYPKEAFVRNGGLVGHPTRLGGQPAGNARNPQRAAEANALRNAWFRKLAVTIPPSALRQGVNVLALEIHRAPASSGMFTSAPLNPGNETFECDLRRHGWWNRAALVELNLTGAAAGAVPNVSRPKGYQVWNQAVFESVDFRDYGDPNERLRPVRLTGARNGTYSGELMVSSTTPIKGFKVSVTELKSGGSSIPATNVDVRYAEAGPDHWTPTERWVDFDTLQPSIGPTVPILTTRNPASLAMQPVWFTVHVPRDAKPGAYVGRITIAAEGEKTVETSLELRVHDWVVPDSRNFVTFMAMVESPESVALQYNVPMWSEAHWKLLDQVFDLLGQIGAKEIYIPVVRQTHFGNQDSMVRWIRQPDGSFKYDFSIVQKYVDTAVKRLGKVPVVCCMIAEPNPQHRAGFLYTEMDPKTGELKDAVGPKWGSAESKAFLKPLLEGLREVLAKRGLENSMMVGMNSSQPAAGPLAPPEVVADVTAAFPEVKWVRLSHYWFGDDFERRGGLRWGRIALVGGVLGVFWDPDQDKPFYGWRNPEIVVVFPRQTDYGGVRLGQDSDLPEHRFTAEGVLLSGRRSPIGGWGRGNLSGAMGYDRFIGVRGVGPFGADFWPVLKGARTNSTVIGRYGESYKDGGWGTVSLSQVVQSLLAPGKDGPLWTMRMEMIREGEQEAEAHVFLQDVLLDKARCDKLPPDLAKRAAQVCYDRTQGLRLVSEFWEGNVISARYWTQHSGDLYETAAEVAKALGTGGAQPDRQ